MKEVLIEEDVSVAYAMKRIEKNSKRILFIQKEGKLLAAITDGDIRRWILDNGSLDAPVKYAANYEPVYIHESQTHMAGCVLKERCIDALPVVDDGKKIKKVVFGNEPEKKRASLKEKIPVVIMAGGLGTRLQPYTSILPKPLIPVGDYPIVEHIINRFLEYGCREYYMVVNYKRNMIKAYFDELERDYSIEYIEEGKMLGTGGGLSLLKGKIEKTFILTNCDILIEGDFEKILEEHRGKGNFITMVCSPQKFVIPYGVVKTTEGGGIESMQEKPEMDILTNTGCYIVEPGVIESLAYNEPASFPDIIEGQRRQGKKVGAYVIEEDAWLDMGQFGELEKMKRRLADG